MKVLLTGFTTKSYQGYADPGSRGIMDLTTVMPMILKELKINFEYATARECIKDYDHVFIKIWNVDDIKYASHVPELINYLKNVDLNKVTLISDHWNPMPALNSMNKVGGFLRALYDLYYSCSLINVYHSWRHHEIDPSIYCDVRCNERKLSPRWIYGSLNSWTPTDTSYPVDVYTELTERELYDKIAKHGLVYLDERMDSDPRWWRIRYYVAAINDVAVYASERDQKAIYGFYVPIDTIERYREDVAALQRSTLLDIIELKSSIHRKVLNLLEKA